MPLVVGKYRPKRMKDDVGQVASFSVGERTGVVLQRVKHTTVLEGHKTTSTFVEGWPAVKGHVRPQNTDYFLIPFAFREVDGRVSISATMWFVEGNPAQILAGAGLQRGAVDIAGLLPARYGPVPAAYRPRSKAIHRKWQATWNATRFKKNFRPAFKNGTQVQKL